MWRFSDAFGTWKFLPKASPLEDVTYWSSVPSGRILSIDNGISRLSLELSFCAWKMGAWFPSVPDSLTDGLSVLLGTLYLITMSSSEYWGPWTDGRSNPLTLHTICSLDFLKHVNRSSAVNHSPSNSGSYYWSNMTWIPELLDVASLIQTSVSVSILITTVDNMSSNTTWYCGEI